MAVTADGGGLLAGGIRRRRVQLRRRASSTARRDAIHLNKPVVGIAATPNGRGYYLVASDGGVFTYGNATFAGSTSGTGTQQADRRHGGDGGRGLLPRRRRRRRLQLRRRSAPAGRPEASRSTSRSSAWASDWTGTTSSPPTVGCSTTPKAGRTAVLRLGGRASGSMRPSSGSGSESGCESESDATPPALTSLLDGGGQVGQRRRHLLFGVRRAVVAHDLRHGGEPRLAVIDPRLGRRGNLCRSLPARSARWPPPAVRTSPRIRTPCSGSNATTVTVVDQRRTPFLLVPSKTAPSAGAVAPLTHLPPAFSGDHSPIRGRSDHQGPDLLGRRGDVPRRCCGVGHRARR